MLSSFQSVVVTSSNPEQCELFKFELERRKGHFFSPECVVQAISDPVGFRVGSGGATLHAIAEAYTGGSMLLLHSGGDSRRNPVCSVTGKAFASANLDPTLLEQLSKLPVADGVLVAATDTLMTDFLPIGDLTKIFAPNVVAGVGIKAPWDFGTRHGVFYQINNKESYGILQKATESELRTFNAVDELGRVLLDSGIVFMGSNVVKALIDLTRYPPLVGLTSRGLDSGVAKPVRFELYTDILGALKDVWPNNDFLNSAATVDEKEIRTVLLQALGNFEFRIVELHSKCQFIHVGTTREHRDLASSISAELPLVSRWKSFEATDQNKYATLINSYLSLSSGSHIGAQALVEHSELTGYVQIGKGAIVSQVQANGLSVPSDVAIQTVPVDLRKFAARFKELGEDAESFIIQNQVRNPYVLVIFGVNDGVKDAYPGGAYLNRPWSELAPLSEYLWSPSVTEKDRSLWNARLFPLLFKDETSMEHGSWLLQASDMPTLYVAKWKTSFRVSISDLAWIADMQSIAKWRHDILPSKILGARFVKALVSHSPYPRDVFPHSLPATTASTSRYLLDHKRALLGALDTFCEMTLNESECARALSLVGDLLAGESQPRSGDSNHPDFASVILRLSRTRAGSKERAKCIRALAAVRDSPYWSSSSLTMLRAARHYDAASQALTGICLSVADVPLKLREEPIPYGRWVHATAPGRIDLSGGWSDTPPITNESGGAVCNVAVTLVKDRPCLGASARTFNSSDGSIQYVLRSGKHTEVPSNQSVICRSYSDFDDHFNPRAPAALAKCVLVALLPPDRLFEQKISLELTLWSDLPAGSGLGGSSILAACAAMAAGNALGFRLEREDIVRIVLKVEQLLSSGGGWQDQVGAIFPSFKIGESPASLPIDVNVTPIPVTDEFLKDFEARTLLVQTGPARLARDLLQNVIRRWHRREDSFTRAIQQLRENSSRMRLGLANGDMDSVCNELNEFWRLKRFVAGEEQAEPKLIKDLFEATSGLVKARSLCGAGGGGFAVFILNNAEARTEFENIVSTQFKDMRVHSVFVCNKGLGYTTEEKPII